MRSLKSNDTLDIDLSTKARLASIKPFNDLPAAVLDALCASAMARQYGAGQTVFSIGQYDATEFFVVLAGRLRVAAIDAVSGAMVVEEYEVDSTFGLELVMSEAQSDIALQFTVTAESDLQLLAFDAEEFRELAAHRPSLMRNLTIIFANELQSRRFSGAPAQAAPERRVYEILAGAVERDAVSGDWKIPVLPKHRELAEQAGVDDGVAASAIAGLIQDGIARRDYPGMIVCDMSRLTQLTT